MKRGSEDDKDHPPEKQPRLPGHDLKGRPLKYEQGIGFYDPDYSFDRETYRFYHTKTYRIVDEKDVVLEDDDLPNPMDADDEEENPDDPDPDSKEIDYTSSESSDSDAEEEDSDPVPRSATGMPIFIMPDSPYWESERDGASVDGNERDGASDGNDESGRTTTTTSSFKVDGANSKDDKEKATGI